MSLENVDPQILADFLTESGELLDGLDQDLVTLESTPTDADLLNRIFRALHTIKGSASFLAITNLVQFAHAAEDALNVIRKGEVKVDESIMDVLLRSVDIVRSQFAQITEGSDPAPGPGELIDRLHAIAAGKSPAPSSGTASSSKAPAPAQAAPVAIAGAESPLDLPAGKLDLLPFMVEDWDKTIQALSAIVADMASSGCREEHSAGMTEQAGNLSRIVDFFEVDALRGPVSILEIAGAHVANSHPNDRDQILPRLLAVLHLMGQQAEALKRSVVRSFNLDTLRDHLVDLLLGNEIPAAARLAPGVSITRTLECEGVAAPPASAASLPSESAAAPAAPAPASAESATDDPKVADKHKHAAKMEATVRVEVGRLESLLNLVGELVIQKNRVSALARQISGNDEVDASIREAVTTVAGDLDRLTGEIQVGVMRTRMQPLDKLFSKYPRVVRDLARGTGKEIRLEVLGGETEVDKSVLEELSDPLVHILRNSADHGVESPEQRQAAGKPAEGVIRIRAEHQGSHVMIQISDDGKGLARARIGAKAVERGIVTADQLASMTDKDVMNLIMLPGFSTAEKVSDLSGRGVGMDVVRTNILKVNGTIDLDSVEGKGTTITIKIPLTVAILSAMMVTVGPAMYAIPLNNIYEIVKPDPRELTSIHGHPVMKLRDRVLPLVNLGTRLAADSTEVKTPFAVVVGAGDNRVGLMVTGLVGQQEIVIKPLKDVVDKSEAVSGATIRDDGGISLILDVTRLVDSAENTLKSPAA